jgi:hypothetical protein
MNLEGNSCVCMAGKVFFFVVDVWVRDDGEERTYHISTSAEDLVNVYISRLIFLRP